MSQKSVPFTPPPPAPPALDDTKMSLMEHLIELRYRLMWIVGGLLVATLACMVFVVPILELITQPLLAAGGQAPQALGPTDSIGIFFKVSFTMGTAVALPLIIYHIISFANPGLYPHERRAILFMLPGVVILFVIGAAFAYLMLLPAAVGFLQNFLGTVISQDWSIDRYISFVTRLVFWIGVSFELPLVMAVLGAHGAGERAATSALLAARLDHRGDCRRRDYAHCRPCQHDAGHGPAAYALLHQRGAGLPALQAPRGSRLLRPVVHSTG